MELKTENIIYEYDSGTGYAKRALDGVSVTIRENEFIGLIGHTGSGKSTFIQHLNGLLKPAHGKVLYNGMDIYSKDFDRRKLRGHVGLVFQYPEYQLFETSVIKDVAFGPKNLGLSEEEAEKRAERALSMVGIEQDYYHTSPFNLSGGQKRRVAIAGVLAMKPEVLILDEPTAGLDPKGRDEILGQIAKIHTNTGNTVILVSHSMDEVAEYVDRVLVIDEGRIVFDDIPKSVFSRIGNLEKMGLAAPQISYIMRDLKAAGFDVDVTALTVPEAKDTIMNALTVKHNL